MTAPLEESAFDELARAELRHIEDQLMDVDPDLVDVSSSDGVLRLDLKDGVRVVVNSHRAARQIWMAAVSSAWHFDYDDADGRWRAGRTGEELRETLVAIVKERVAISLPI